LSLKNIDSDMPRPEIYGMWKAVKTLSRRYSIFINFLPFQKRWCTCKHF